MSNGSAARAGAGTDAPRPVEWKMGWIALSGKGRYRYVRGNGRSRLFFRALSAQL
jgi:hypothetical protein